MVEKPLKASFLIEQVAEHLFLGNVETAFNEPVLCRHQITCLIDVSALLPNQIAAHRKSICPCPCPLQKAHIRNRLNIPILDRENQDLLPYLKDINVFIHLNRLNGRNVLVFSDAGYSRAPTIILQYLIQVENMSLAKSLILLTSQRYQPNINSGFMKTLRKLERKREFVEPMLNSPSWKPAWH